MSSNCIGNAVSRRLHRRRLQRAKTAVAIRNNVLGIVERFGIERVGVLTLTFADGLRDASEAQRRFRSFRTNLLMPRYGGYLRVFERTRRGAIHYHVLLPTSVDIRTGYHRPEPGGIRKTAASPALRAEWALLRESAPRYGFGRISFEPILESPDALAAYLAKTLENENPTRALTDDGVRIFEMSRNLRTANTHFSWLSPGSTQWRLKVGVLAERAVGAGLISPHHQDEALKELHGPAWALGLRNKILAMPDIQLQTAIDADSADSRALPGAQAPNTEHPNPEKETSMMYTNDYFPTNGGEGEKCAPRHPIHPLSALFPKLASDEFAALVADIKANGLHEPITLLGDAVLDGRNRYEACIEAGVEPRFVQFQGADPAAFVLTKNLHRRHLKPGQEASIVALATDWTNARQHGGDRKSDQGANLHLDSVADRAALSGASERTQKMADKLAREAPELAAKVAQGEVSLSAAAASRKQAKESCAGDGACSAIAAEDQQLPSAESVPEKWARAGTSADPRDARISELKAQAAELSANLEEALADIASMSKVFEANDQVVTAVAESKKYREQARLLDERVTGLTNEKNQYVRLTKNWKGIAEKLRKAQRTAA